MKTLQNYITEKILINKNSKLTYNYYPKTKFELRNLLSELIRERGENANLNDIDVSELTDFSKCFLHLNVDFANIDISQWNVSNAKDMSHMFDCQIRFNCDLSKWDVSNVENMKYMFSCCYAFEGKGLEHWDISKVKESDFMFYNCKKIQCDLSSWDLTNCNTSGKMFEGTKLLDNKKPKFK